MKNKNDALLSNEDVMWRKNNELCKLTPCRREMTCQLQRKQLNPQQPLDCVLGPSINLIPNCYSKP